MPAMATSVETSPVTVAAYPEGALAPASPSVTASVALRLALEVLYHVLETCSGAHAVAWAM